VRVLDAVASTEDLDIRYFEVSTGGSAIDSYGTPLRDEDLENCGLADAILLGAVGGPAWDNLPVGSRPESGLLRLRSELGLGINLRPVRWTNAGSSRSPLKAEVAAGADIAFVRELTGGVYFGKPSFRRTTEGGEEAVDTAHYTTDQIIAVLDFAFDLARSRSGRVVSVDKANVMNTSRLWREVATEYGKKNSDVSLSHALVDSFAMQLMQTPRDFDVVVTENLFGDILTDLAAVIAGSLGTLPSASLRPGAQARHFGMYEPIHGSAPAIAGQDLANPMGAILSVALMLEWSVGRRDLAEKVRVAVQRTLDARVLTADLAPDPDTAAGTEQFVEAVVAALDEEGGAHGRESVRYHVA
jgi:3-isopropylmalate dehydrogenase